MKVVNFKEMIRGWFVGNFEPNAFKTESCEVAVHEYKKGEFIKAHHHKIATEISMVLYGKFEMFNRIYNNGDILIIYPNEGSDFLVLEDTKLVVVKVPGVLNDKYDGLPV